MSSTTSSRRARYALAPLLFASLCGACVEEPDDLAAAEQAVEYAPPPMDELTSPIDFGVRAEFVARIAGRSLLSFEAYDEETQRYRDDYVHPTSWALNFSACASAAVGTTIRDYRWEISGPGSFSATVTTTDCKLLAAPRPTAGLPVCHDLDPVTGRETDDYCDGFEPTTVQPPRSPRLPVLGTYTVRLTVTGVDGRADQAQESITIDDIVIAAVGDSFASGEGNPHLEGDDVRQQLARAGRQVLEGYVEQSFNLDEVIDVTGLAGTELPTERFTPGFLLRLRDAEWLDEPCHRSFISGPVITALTYEATHPHTAVTFISHACSGAKIKHLVNKDQNPSRPGVDRTQLSRVALDVGAREVDFLLMAIGINELDFKEIVVGCANPVAGCPDEDVIAARLATLPAKYDGLARAIGQRLQVQEIVLADYPNHLLEDEAGILNGCGVFHEVHPDEAQFMRSIGTRLNSHGEDAAGRNGWAYAGGGTALFATHGYCADHSYFRGFVDSVAMQGDREGTLHPNAAGHTAFGQNLFTQLRFEEIDATLVRVRIESFKVTNTEVDAHEAAPALPTRVNFVAISDADVASFSFVGVGGVIPLATTIDVSTDGDYAFEIWARGHARVAAIATLPPYFTEVRENNHPVETLHPARNLEVSEVFGPADGFAPGRYTRRSQFPGGSVEVTFTIEADVEVIPTVPTRRLGGTLADEGRAVAYDRAGNLFATGNLKDKAKIEELELTAEGPQNGWVVKMGRDGTVAWRLLLGGGGIIFATDIAVDPVGDAIVTGYFSGVLRVDGHGYTADGTDGFVAKVFGSGPLAGKLAWLQQFTGPATDRVQAVAVDPLGRALVLGEFQSTMFAGETNYSAQAAYDCFLAWVDDDGRPLYGRTMRSAGNCLARDVASDQEGNLIAVAAHNAAVTLDPVATLGTLAGDGGYDGLVAKYTPSGQFWWAHYLGGTSANPGDADPQAVGTDGAGNVHVAGSYKKALHVYNFQSFLGPSARSIANTWDGFVTSYSPGGTPRGTSSHGGNGDDFFTGIGVQRDGSHAVSGRFNSLNASFGGTTLCRRGATSAVVARFWPSRNLAWAIRLGNGNSADARDVSVSADDAVAVTGSFDGRLNLASDVSLLARGSTDAFIAHIPVPDPAYGYSSCVPDLDFED